MKSSLSKWILVIGCGLVLAIVPPPEGVSRDAWMLFAIFIATIVGSIVQPLTGSAMVLLGVITLAANAGFADRAGSRWICR
ncbi:MAG: anion permease [Pyrinomonadaceae bacterium]